MSDTLYKYYPIKQVDLDKLEGNKYYTCNLENNIDVLFSGKQMKLKFTKLVQPHIKYILLPVEQKQISDEAINFANWVNKNHWIQDPFPLKEFDDEELRWSDIATIDIYSDMKLTHYTTEQLFNLFKKSNK